MRYAKRSLPEGAYLLLRQQSYFPSIGVGFGVVTEFIPNHYGAA